MTKYFLDLKENDKLIIGNSELEVRVLKLIRTITGNRKALLDIYRKGYFERGRKLIVNGRRYVWLDDGIGFWNTGNRHHGNRIHINLVLPNGYLYKKC